MKMLDNLRPNPVQKESLARILLDLRSVGGTTNYTKFVIVGIARTGSTMLISQLNSHSHTLAFGELFRSPDAVGWDVAPFAGDQSPRLLALYRADPVGFLKRRVYRRWPSSYRAIGFKLFYYHAQTAPQSSIWDYLSERRDIRVLHLKRRNMLAQYASLALAHTTDVWSSTRPLAESAQSLQLDPEDCRQHFAWVRGLEENCASLFKGHQVLDLYYEDLIRESNREMTAVQEFLGLNIEKLPARTVRQRTRPLSQVITNYAELGAAFRATEWAEFFDLPTE